MEDQQEQSWKMLVARILACRTQKERAGMTARLRRGISEATECYAYADVLPFLDQRANKNQRTAILRSAAIIASFPEIEQCPNDKRLTLGRTMRVISMELANDEPTIDPDKPDTVASRLRQLPYMNVHEAAMIIYRIFSLHKKGVLYCDYFDLTRTLLYWGNGISQSSREHRNQILVDYYRGNSKASK